MFFRFKFTLTAIAFSLCLFPHYAYAGPRTDATQRSANEHSPDKAIVIWDFEAIVPFLPQQLEALILTQGSTVVERTTAAFLPLENIAPGRQEIALSATIPADRLNLQADDDKGKGGQVYLAFLLQSSQGQWFGVGVEGNGSTQFPSFENALSKSSADSERIAVEVADLRAKREALGEEIKKLASAKNVDSLVSLMDEIKKVKSDSDGIDRDSEAFVELLKRAENFHDTDSDIDAWRSLSLDLQKVARKTATADRLLRQKALSARHQTRERSRISEEYKNADIDALTKELLMLTQKRKQLQVRIDPSTVDPGDEL